MLWPYAAEVEAMHANLAAKAEGARALGQELAAGCPFYICI